MINPFDYPALASMRDLQQTSSIDHYYSYVNFLRSLILYQFPEIWDAYFLSCFICGLKTEIQKYVIQCNPTNLIDAYELACIAEYSSKVTQTPSRYHNHVLGTTYDVSGEETVVEVQVNRPFQRPKHTKSSTKDVELAIVTTATLEVNENVVDENAVDVISVVVSLGTQVVPNPTISIGYLVCQADEDSFLLCQNQEAYDMSNAPKIIIYHTFPWYKRFSSAVKDYATSTTSVGTQFRGSSGRPPPKIMVPFELHVFTILSTLTESLSLHSNLILSPAINVCNKDEKGLEVSSTSILKTVMKSFHGMRLQCHACTQSLGVPSSKLSDIHALRLEDFSGIALFWYFDVHSFLHISIESAAQMNCFDVSAAGIHFGGENNESLVMFVNVDGKTFVLTAKTLLAAIHYSGNEFCGLPSTVSVLKENGDKDGVSVGISEVLKLLNRSLLSTTPKSVMFLSKRKKVEDTVIKRNSGEMYPQILKTVSDIEIVSLLLLVMKLQMFVKKTLRSGCLLLKEDLFNVRLGVLVFSLGSVIKSREDFSQFQFDAAGALTNITSGISETTRVVIQHGAISNCVKLLTTGSISCVHCSRGRGKVAAAYHCQMVTVDGHDFWFMGCANYANATLHLSQRFSEFKAVFQSSHQFFRVIFLHFSLRATSAAVEEESKVFLVATLTWESSGGLKAAGIVHITPENSSYESLKNFRQISPVVQNHLQEVYVTVCCAWVASAVGVHLHLLLNLGGALTLVGCLGSLVWLLSTPPYEERKRHSLMMTTASFQGSSIGPLLAFDIDINPSILINAFVGTAIAFGCFSATTFLARHREYLSSGLSMLCWLQFPTAAALRYDPNTKATSVAYELSAVVSDKQIMADASMLVCNSGTDKVSPQCLLILLATNQYSQPKRYKWVPFNNDFEAPTLIEVKDYKPDIFQRKWLMLRQLRKLLRLRLRLLLMELQSWMGIRATVDYIPLYIENKQQKFIQSGGVRPFVLSTLSVGFDTYTGVPSLSQTDPLGTFSNWEATATGRYSNVRREFLEKNYKGTSGSETVQLTRRALLEVADSGVGMTESALVYNLGTIMLGFILHWCFGTIVATRSSTTSCDESPSASQQYQTDSSGSVDMVAHLLAGL